MRPDEIVRNFLHRKQLRSVPVICALSGGADSVCLLYCLRQCREEFDLQISALHIQHQLRGEESLRDENFCRALCQDWNVSLQVVTVPVREYAQQHHLSLETAARECRYQIFAEAGLVATAHTADDNLETILFRIARGTGLKGLCGIPPERDHYIRPLLEASGADVRAYLHEKHISFVTDSTNLTDDYSRNFTRHHITPLLSEVHAHAELSAVRMTEILRQEEQYLSEAAEQAYQNALQPDGSLKQLHLLHPAMQRRCISLLLQNHQIPADYQNITAVQKLLEHGGRTELIRGRMTACVSQHQLYLQETRSVPELPLQIGNNYLIPGYVLQAELINHSEKSERIYKMSANSALDYDIIEKNLILHGRKPGLYLKPAGRTHTVSVRKWLQSIPVSQRQTVHYLSDVHGLLWVQGLGVSQHAAVTEQTERILFLHIHEIHTQFS